jgi:hypothetical protein
VSVLNATDAPPTAQLAPRLTPRGHLLAAAEADAAPLANDLAMALTDAFAEGSGGGLLYLGTALPGRALPPAWAWWRDFATRHVVAACGHEGDAAPPDALELATGIVDAPPMIGAEYLDADVLGTLWCEIGAALRAELAGGLTLEDFLRSRHTAWHVVGRVHFNLAENRKDPAAPFAFLATYVSGLSAQGKAQHLPLSRALAEFAGAKQKARLLALLQPVQRAAETCEWLPPLIAAGEIYHPLRWQPQQAWRFLLDVPRLEAAGIVVRAPGQWPAGRPARPKVAASVGSKQPSAVGLDALLDFQVAVTLDGEKLSKQEIEALLAGSDGLQLLRGRWVEVDRKQLGRLLERFGAIEKLAAENGLSFAEAMRLAAGASFDDTDLAATAEWAEIGAGPWLADVLKGLRQPEGLAQVDAGDALKATLRPYQQAGVRWLYLLSRLGLGACLADDMGLGKTIQVLALLLVLQAEKPGRPSLLVAPASLLANWADEAARFAPSLRILVVHPSALGADEMRALDERRLASADLVITSYGTLLRQPLLADRQWRLAVLDEAQAIKNPGAKQTRAGEAAPGRSAHRAHRHAGREPPVRSVVDCSTSRIRGCSAATRPSPRFAKRLAARRLRPAARARAALHPAPAEDRPARHRRSAGQDRSHGLVPSRAARSRPRSISSAVEPNWRRRWTRRKASSGAARAGLPDALQADLQPPFAVAGRRRLLAGQ